MEYQNKIPIAVEQHSKLDLPYNHIGSAQFMLLHPMYYRHTMKTEKLQLAFTSVVRPQPIAVPLFGEITHNLRHFFVPYRLVFPNWEEFIGDVVASNVSHSSQVAGAPYFDANDLMTLFTSPTYNFTTIVTSGEDFKVTGNLYRFTTLGKHAYQLLYSLGYDLVGFTKGGFEFNALALLAYAKVYCDWYSNSQYLNSAPYLALQQMFKHNDPTTRLHITDAMLYQIIMFVRPVVYKSNVYYEDAWDNPVSPNNGQFTSFTFTDPTSTNGSRVVMNSNGTPEMMQQNASSTSLGTDYLHTALKKLAQYQHRHALSGARAIDRVLAEYGLKTDNLRLQRSIYCGVTSHNVNVDSVFATANGQNSLGASVVGDYSGAGYGSTNGMLDFQNDEEGIFITISSIVPSGGYWQGYDRNNRHKDKTQFFNAAFDTLGVQSIEKGEVYVSKDFDSFITDAGDYGQHFGFTGRYAEYKRSIDRISGDLALPAHLAGGSSWHLMRTFTDTYFGNNVVNVTHDEDFARGSDGGQYNRIFTYTNEEPELDPFNVFLHVECKSYAPCGHLTDEFDWDSEAPQIDIASNGPKLN